MWRVFAYIKWLPPWIVCLKLHIIQTVIIQCNGHHLVCYLINQEDKKTAKNRKTGRWGSVGWFPVFIKCVTCMQCKRPRSCDISIVYPLRLTSVLKYLIKINQSTKRLAFRVKYTCSYYWVYLSRKTLGIFNVSPLSRFMWQICGAILI